MSSQETAERTVGELLLAKGWTQGVIFRARDTSVAYNVCVNDDESQPGMTIETRPLKANESLVLVTQDCDLLASREQWVEAFICRVEKKDSYRSDIDRNSARHFVVHPDGKLVAYATHRVLLDKKALMELEFQPWPGTQVRKRRFVQWLGRRFTRPAIPDALVKAFDDRVISTYERLAAEHPDEIHAFNSIVQEIRVTAPSSERQPFELNVVFLAYMGTDSIGEDTLAAVDLVWAEIKACLQPERVQLNPLLDIKSDEQMSVAEYFATRALFLDYATYQGEEIGGAEPHGAA